MLWSPCHARSRLSRHHHGHSRRSRTIEVQASSLFEAVAGGLLAIRVGDLAIPDGFRPVKVVVIETHTEYAVRLKDFVKWLDRRGNSPGDVTYRKKIRSILQLRRPGQARYIRSWRSTTDCSLRQARSSWVSSKFSRPFCAAPYS
jgi:hypothetical protein